MLQVFTTGTYLPVLVTGLIQGHGIGAIGVRILFLVGVVLPEANRANVEVAVERIKTAARTLFFSSVV